MKTLYSITLLILLINFPVKKIMEQNTGKMDKLFWIADNWISTEGDTKSYEHWEKVSDDLLIGGSETLKNGDTIFAEKLKIEKTDEGIFYVADVKHNPEPVRFKLTEVNDSLAVFENPEHDFPIKITYINEDGNLHSFIEGPGKDGKNKKIDFYMIKMR